MLALTRKRGQRIMIGEGIVLTVLSVNRGRIRLGIEAPAHVPIRRGELDVIPADPSGESLLSEVELVEARS